jgi:hypothetical protein
MDHNCLSTKSNIVVLVGGMRVSRSMGTNLKMRVKNEEGGPIYNIVGEDGRDVGDL